jgi:hypothetical protein
LSLGALKAQFFHGAMGKTFFKVEIHCDFDDEPYSASVKFMSWLKFIRKQNSQDGALYFIRIFNFTGLNFGCRNKPDDGSNCTFS